MKKLEVALQGQDGGRNDRKWFPFWLRKYAALCVQETGQPPAVEREVVIAFLHRRRLNGRPAWQRLQAVRAVAFYRSRVRRRGEPVPLIRVRGNLDALIVRSVFYDLVEMATERHIDGRPVLGVTSCGVFYALGSPDDADG